MANLDRGSDAGTGNGRGTRRIESICSRFEELWRNGHRPRIEDVINRVPEAIREPLFAELLLREISLMAESGERVSLEDYVRRFPGKADVLSTIAPSLVTNAGRDRGNDSRTGSPDGSPLINPDSTRTYQPLVGKAARGHVAESPSPGALSRGTSLGSGELRVLSRLDSGGMGDVYLAWHNAINSEVVVKVSQDRSTETRFRNEIQVHHHLGGHPHIASAKTAGWHEGRPYLVIEYVPGVDLRRQVANVGPLPYRQAARLIRQAATGLDHAHARGVIHRDIKPSNLVLSESDGVVKVLDWGLAIRIGEGRLPIDERLTQPGALLGTIDYIPPEQIKDPGHVGPAADLYSLGCTFYFLLTGHPPFHGVAGLKEKITSHLEKLVPPLPVDLLVPPELEAILRRLLAKRAYLRYQGASEFIEALDQAVEASSDPSRGAAPAAEPPRPDHDHSRDRVHQVEALLAAASASTARWGPIFALFAFLVLISVLLLIRWPITTLLTLLAVGSVPVIYELRSAITGRAGAAIEVLAQILRPLTAVRDRVPRTGRAASIAAGILATLLIAGLAWALIDRRGRPRSPLAVARIESKTSTNEPAHPVSESRIPPEAPRPEEPAGGMNVPAEQPPDAEPLPAPAVPAPPDLIKSMATIRGEKINTIGFVVKPGVLLTSADAIRGEYLHCLELKFGRTPIASPSTPGPNAANPFLNVGARKGTMSLTLLHTDDRLDIAVFALGNQVPALALSEVEPKAGARVAVYDFASLGLGRPRETTLAEASGPSDPSLLRIQGTIGNSDRGSPAFDADGRVLGLILGPDPDGQGALAASAADLSAIVDLALRRRHGGGARTIEHEQSLLFQNITIAAASYARAITERNDARLVSEELQVDTEQRWLKKLYIQGLTHLDDEGYLLQQLRDPVDRGLYIQFDDVYRKAVILRDRLTGGRHSFSGPNSPLTSDRQGPNPDNEAFLELAGDLAETLGLPAPEVPEFGPIVRITSSEFDTKRRGNTTYVDIKCRLRNTSDRSTEGLKALVYLLPRDGWSVIAQSGPVSIYPETLEPGAVGRFNLEFPITQAMASTNSKWKLVLVDQNERIVPQLSPGSPKIPMETPP